MVDGDTITERGGPTTGAGTSYQAWVTAHWLAKLLEPSDSFEDAVVEVRVESREPVDDIEVSFQSGIAHHIQAKRRIEPGTKTWKTFWKHADSQISTTRQDFVILAVGVDDDRWDVMRTVLERSREATDPTDARAAWNNGRAQLADFVENVKKALPRGTSDAEIWKLFRQTKLEAASSAKLKSTSAEVLPAASQPPEIVAGCLAEIATAALGSRQRFTASSLRTQLAKEYGITFDPHGAGVVAYLARVKREFNRLSIEGFLTTTLNETFTWPTLHQPPRENHSDRFTELRDHLGSLAENPHSLLELDGRHTVVIAGAGFGKSSLLHALGLRAIETSRIPVYISLPIFASLPSETLSKTSVLDYVVSNVARNLSVSWDTHAARGELALLFDGIDEVAPNRRPTITRHICEFAAEFPRVPWVLAARDPAAATVKPDVAERWVAPIASEKRLEFYSRYTDDDHANSIVRILDKRPSLDRICSIPLFATLLAGNVQKTGLNNVPSGPVELLEQYIEFLLDPARVREAVELGLPPQQLRGVASKLALSGLRKETPVLSLRDARSVIGTDANTKLNDLSRAGLVRRGGSTVQFAVPTVQEYLAGELLAASAPEQIPTYISRPTRPWGQALQFALVHLDNPNDVIQDILDLPDDVFASQLRAVARAIAWGANVTSAPRAQVGERLADFWRRERLPFGLRQEVISLLSNTFTDPMPPQIINWLRENGLTYGAVGEFCRNAPDDVILDALEVTLSSKEWFSFGPDVRSRLRELGPRVVPLVIHAFDAEQDNEKFNWATTRFLHEIVSGNKNARQVLEERLSAEGLDNLAAEHARMAANPNQFAQKIQEESLRDDLVGSYARDLLWSLTDIKERWEELMTDSSTPRPVRHYLFADILENMPVDGEMWIRKLEATGSHRVALEALAALAVQRDETAFEKLTDQLDYSDVEEIL